MIMASEVGVGLILRASDMPQVPLGTIEIIMLSTRKDKHLHRNSAAQMPVSK